MKVNGTDIAEQGTIWVCGACGKRARTRYGIDVDNKSTALDSGWDESCTMHAVLCFENSIVVKDGRITAIAVEKLDAQ